MVQRRLAYCKGGMWCCQIVVAWWGYWGWERRYFLREL